MHRQACGYHVCMNTSWLTYDLLLLMGPQWGHDDINDVRVWENVLKNILMQDPLERIYVVFLTKLS